MNQRTIYVYINEIKGILKNDKDLFYKTRNLEALIEVWTSIKSNPVCIRQVLITRHYKVFQTTGLKQWAVSLEKGAEFKEFKLL